MIAPPAQVLQCIGGMAYPADKKAILTYAEAHGADKDVLKTLQRIPEQEYASTRSVSKELTRAE